MDDIANCAIRLPEDDGLIFPRGYYLENGGYKKFELETPRMSFREMLPSSNGEDYLYTFYNAEQGEYVLLQYNLIEKKVENPVHCHGYAIYDDGELIYFKHEDQARKNHPIQIWQTPFVADHKLSQQEKTTEMDRIGNKQLVRGVADLRAIYNLLQNENVFLGLYQQIVRRVTNTLDFHHWLEHPEVFNPQEILKQILDTATSALNEYEKVVQIKNNTNNALKKARSEVEILERSTGGRTYESVEQFVEILANLQLERGKVISLRELRYADTALIDQLEETVRVMYDKVAGACVDFLLGPTALNPFMEKLTACEAQIPELGIARELKKVGEDIAHVNDSLNLLTELVNNLKIEDPTRTAKIIDSISAVYSRVNQIRAIYKKRLGGIQGKEASAEFGSQFKLIGQSVSNFLDQAQSPEDCEKSLTKVLVQLEELEARFADFEDFIEKLTLKREEVYSAFNSRKVQLEEARNKRSQTLWNSADRILKGISNHTARLKDIDELNAYFAGDSMVTKVRDIIERLAGSGDSVRSEDIAGRLKSLRQEGARQLKDKQDLFAEGENIITFGAHKFLISSGNVELTTVMRDNEMFFHLTGTDFFEEITDPEFLSTRPLWDQEWISETREIYRAEFLAFKLIGQIHATNDPLPPDEFLDICRKADQEVSFLLKDAREAGAESLDQAALQKSEFFGKLLELVRQFMAGLFAEGYEKGVHDADCARILASLYPVYRNAGTLRFHPTTRACAYLYRFFAPESEEKTLLERKIRSLGVMKKITEVSPRNKIYVEELRVLLDEFRKNFNFPFDPLFLRQTPEYLFEELQEFKGATNYFPVSAPSYEIYLGFREFLKKKRALKSFNDTVESIGESISGRLAVIYDWMEAFIEQNPEYSSTFLLEAVCMTLGETLDNKLDGDLDQGLVKKAGTETVVADLLGRHPRMDGHNLKINVSDFLIRLESFTAEQVPAYQNFVERKHALVEAQKEHMRLEEFRPRVLSSFVRNRLIDTTYLPLVGANLAKQMGSYGETKRTDLMGLLLLISPPGYGKTTLMEYIANRLGLIFMKINCPSIGHNVTSLDPDEAPNATAREEVQKLNLSLEMGNNVMIYLDDIQHTNPEFLQKFISLTDAQRKIEGVYRGRTRTYDLRGKRVAVVMAGNPYTESGEKFQVPDMLANRADVYNLGDVLGGHEDAFKLSYLENCLTSNQTLVKLASRSQKDVYEMIKIARSGSSEGVQFETNYSAEEVKEFTSVFKRLLEVQKVILKVNQQYIHSAAQDDTFRTEPRFLLQGSYRNMNKLAEKIAPVTNKDELKQLILDHYQDESQLLTSGAEFNILKFKEMLGWIDDTEKERLEFIRRSFQKNLSLGNVKDGDPMSQIIGQFNLFNERFDSLANSLQKPTEK